MSRFPRQVCAAFVLCAASVGSLCSADAPETKPGASAPLPTIDGLPVVPTDQPLRAARKKELEALRKLWEGREYEQFLEQSQSFIDIHNEQMIMWVMRASAALALNRPRDGWQAGKNLRFRGGEQSEDPRVREAIDALKARGWMEPRIPEPARPGPGRNYKNSFGMKLVPVPGTEVLFSTWETRALEYYSFTRFYTNVFPQFWSATFKDNIISPTFYHPAIDVSWKEAEQFCTWLTERELKGGWLTPGQHYRLPTDAEWSTAVGLEGETGTTPAERNCKVAVVFPWGKQWPPPEGVGNFADLSFSNAFPRLKSYNMPFFDYDDGFPGTAPVGSFPPNRFGIYDLSGNVWELCEDYYDEKETVHVMRGGSWMCAHTNGLGSCSRGEDSLNARGIDGGFRCVLVVGADTNAAPAKAQKAP